MSQPPKANHLDRPVDDVYDHVLGPPDAQITLVEYGSYACPHCRAANERIATVRDRLGERVRYVFRHRPIAGNELARPAAELAELAGRERFWQVHVELMTRSATLTQQDLQAVSAELGLASCPPGQLELARREARARVEADIASSSRSGVLLTPTFFINGRRYEGPWDDSSLEDAMLGSLGHRVRVAALDFARWAPSTGVLLLLASVLAIVLMNTGLGPDFGSIWETPWGVIAGGTALRMPLRDWVNDGLLTAFFLVVGLEIKREFTVGHLASLKSAALPIAAAIGGMILPALLYRLAIGQGDWTHGWGVPMATDTAFAVALIAMLGDRVPVQLRIFLTAAAIVDDIGAIVVVALFYADTLQPTYLAASAGIVALLFAMNRAHVYRLSPYLLLGAVLWACIHASGVHSTLAGVLLALFIPTRPPPDLRALTTQAAAIVANEARHEGEALRHGPSELALEALDAIHERMESPADRLLRHAGPRSSYIVLPLFALANAGVSLGGHDLAGHRPLLVAIGLGLLVGKPLGLLGAALLAVRLGLANKPAEYSWTQLAGAGALAGIGFTMSLFIAGQAFPGADDFAAAKLGVFAASALSAVVGVAMLWRPAQTSSSLAR